MLLLAVAQAVTMLMLGPQSPNSMEMMPVPMLLIIIGMVNGDTRLGPLVMRLVWFSSRYAKPPMPLPTMAPTRPGSKPLSPMPD